LDERDTAVVTVVTIGSDVVRVAVRECRDDDEGLQQTLMGAMKKICEDPLSDTLNTRSNTRYIP